MAALSSCQRSLLQAIGILYSCSSIILTGTISRAAKIRAVRRCRAAGHRYGAGARRDAEHPCPEAAALLHQAAPEKSLASWAIRWVASLPNVLCVLSGMTTLEQVQDNVASMDPFIPLSTTEQDTLARALDVFKAQKLAPCTACKYCMPCPAGVNIPGMLHAWNEYRLCGDRLATLKEEYEDAPAATRAEHCIKCGACLPKCPQHIDIRSMMSTICDTL